MVLVGLAALLFLAHLGFGAWRIALATNTFVPQVRLRIVQPNIDQLAKLKANEADDVFKRYLELSDVKTGPDHAGIAGTTVLIWPETAVPFILTERPDALAALAALLPDGTSLITGAVRVEPATGTTEARYFNSVYVIGDNGVIRAAYDKVHLVPFGEYLPFQSFFDSLGILQLNELPGGFSAGTRHRTLTLPNAPPFAPLICYEAIFPGAILEPGNRPGWLLNVTNDAWFGDTAGPRQHFLQSRLRAVEEGLPLVRAANSGISAIVDPYGRVLKRLGLDRVGVVDGDLPVALPPTVYARFGDWPFLVWLLTTAIAAVVGRSVLTRGRN